MEMITVSVSIPKDMAPFIDWEDTGLTWEQNAMLLYPMIQNSVISHGRAAEILGISKWNLIEFYNSIGLSYLHQTHEDLDEEIAGFAQLKEKRAK